MKSNKYLVRPHDMHIFELDEYNGCYRSYTNRSVVYADTKERPHAYDHFTYENLTENYNFFPIDEEMLTMYEYFTSICSDFSNWQGRPDGHGGCKGGTFEEFMLKTISRDV